MNYFHNKAERGWKDDNLPFVSEVIEKRFYHKCHRNKVFLHDVSADVAEDYTDVRSSYHTNHMELADNWDYSHVSYALLEVKRI